MRGRTVTWRTIRRTTGTASITGANKGDALLKTTLKGSLKYMESTTKAHKAKKDIFQNEQEHFQSWQKVC